MARVRRIKGQAEALIRNEMRGTPRTVFQVISAISAESGARFIHILQEVPPPHGDAALPGWAKARDKSRCHGDDDIGEIAEILR